MVVVVVVVEQLVCWRVRCEMDSCAAAVVGVDAAAAWKLVGLSFWRFQKQGVKRYCWSTLISAARVLVDQLARANPNYRTAARDSWFLTRKVGQRG